jgi:hypothetical protein
MDAGIELAGPLIDNGGNIDYLDWGDDPVQRHTRRHLRWADRPSRPVTPRDATGHVRHGRSTSVKRGALEI